MSGGENGCISVLGPTPSATLWSSATQRPHAGQSLRCTLAVSARRRNSQIVIDYWGWKSPRRRAAPKLLPAQQSHV